MSKEKIENVQPVAKQTFSKSAFLDASENTNDRVLLDVLLKEEQKYSREEVADLVQAWKQKPVTEKGADA